MPGEGLIGREVMADYTYLLGKVGAIEMVFNHLGKK